MKERNWFSSFLKLLECEWVKLIDLKIGRMEIEESISVYLINFSLGNLNV